MPTENSKERTGFNTTGGPAMFPSRASYVQETRGVLMPGRERVCVIHDILASNHSRYIRSGAKRQGITKERGDVYHLCGGQKTADTAAT
jgi:hypothetical protein